MSGPINNEPSFDHCKNQSSFLNSPVTPLTSASFNTSPQTSQMASDNEEIIESIFNEPDFYVGSKNLEDIEEI